MKYFIKKIVRRAGFDIRRLSAASNPLFQVLLGLRKFKIDMLIDVGANVGQFALELRSVGYTGRIVSFEPLNSAHAKLSHAAARIPNWEVHRRCALGDFDGEIRINIAGNSVSSSILPMLESHSSAAEGSSYISSETVPIVKLDTVAPEYLSKGDRVFIKIDTQGFEWQVLDGASATLKHVQGLMCELSLVPLYAGEHLWMELINRLKSEGFTLWAIQPGFKDLQDGRTLQIDAIFFRTDSVN